MKEVTKPNDIFASVLLNPTADIPDMLANGVNGTNTGLLTADDYKHSKFVQQAFTNKDGVFDVEKFNQVYNYAQEKYNLLQSVQLYSDLNEYAQYNQNDIYAPIQSLKTGKDYEMKKVRNPMRVSEGVSSLFGKGEEKYSKRELAQMHKVWDSENEKWLDYTAEDQGFLGLKYLGRNSLVYAAWDEDGIHYDPFLKRDVRHKKGEWKTDEAGMYYTETIGKKQGYGKEFVAYSDILTKEDSWANNIDFFDSDDKKKSIAGTVAKTVAAVAPYLIPGFREVWGGITAAVALSSVMPTFAKMMEGIVLGDKETGFTKAMNATENFFNKFDDSYSDKGKLSTINFETLMGTVGDIFGQLYQMRAAASLSNLYTKQFTRAQKDSYDAFVKKFGREWLRYVGENADAFAKNPNAFQDLWKSLAESTPEMKDLIKKQSQLSKSLSLGYMALTSSADVYSDAIQGGYDRRMAGLAGLMATAGLYAIMSNNRLGDWFLDATTGYKANVSRNVMRETLKPYYDKIAEASTKLAASNVGKEEKISTLSKLFTSVFKTGPKKFGDLIKYGGEEFWKKGIIEGVEEVTEEAVMDATKGMFDILSAAGIGKNSETASFGGVDNVFSKEGLSRYAMSFIGGTIGGSIFELQRRGSLPKVSDKEARYSIIQEIMNGNTGELLAEIDRMTAADTQPVLLSEQGVQNPLTRGQVIADTLKQYVRFVEGIILDNGISLEKLTSDELIKKVVRTKMLQPVIEESGLMDMITSDFIAMVDDFVSTNQTLQEKTSKDSEETDTDKTDKKDNTEEYSVSDSGLSKLQKQAKEQKQNLVDFLNGKREEEYLKTALLYLNPALRESALGVDKYSWTKSVYNVDYSSLPQSEATLSKDQIDREYKEWKEKANDLEKFRKVGVPAFDQMEKEFSGSIEEYANTAYGDVRKITIDRVLSQLNFDLNNAASEQEWREALKQISSDLHEAGLKGVSLEDQLQIGEKTKEKLVSIISGVNRSLFDRVIKFINTTSGDLIERTAEDLQKTFETTLLEMIQNFPIEELSPEVLQNFIQTAYKPIAEILTHQLFQSFDDSVDINTAKVEADNLLSELGFEPHTIDLDGDPKIAISNYIAEVTSPTSDITSNINLTTDVLEEYINSQEIIDDEIVRKIKSALYNAVAKHKKNIIQLLRSGELQEGDTIMGYKELVFKNRELAPDILLYKLKLGLDQNTPLKDIVEDWLYSERDGVIDTNHEFYLELEEEVPNTRQIAVDTVVNYIKSLPEYTLYESAITKTTKSNPLFEKLRNFGMKVFDGDDMTIFELLENESKYMSSLSTVGEYIRQGITKEAIDNFISKLDLLQAIVIGMEDSGVSPEHQIAYNIQLKQWNEKWKDGKDASKYKTISTENVHLINADIELLKNKLLFAKTLIETNTESKRTENKKALLNFESAILSIFEEAGALTIKGVSILPPQDELDKLTTQTEKLALIEHTLYEKILSLVEKGNSIPDVLNELFTSLKINKGAILMSGLASYGLSSTQTNISPYDFFTWLVSTIAVDNYEFYAKYKTILEQESYKFVPFFVQEYGAKVMYSFATDTKNIHKLAVDWLYSGVTDVPNQKTTNMFFLNGIAGAGKTTAVMSLVKVMLNSDSVWAAAPNKRQAENLSSSLTSILLAEDKIPTFDKLELLSKLLTKEGLQALEKVESDPNAEDSIFKRTPTSNGKANILTVEFDEKFVKKDKDNDFPKIIFIDEATHFNLAELISLDTAARKHGIKIIGAGDTLLKGALIDGKPVNIDYIFAWRSPALTISVRAANIHTKANTDTIQSILRHVETQFLSNGYNISDPKIVETLKSDKPINYYQTTSELHGSKLVDDITVNDLKVIKEASSGGKSVAVIANMVDGKIADQTLITKLKDAGFTESDYEVYSPEDFSAKPVLGAEAEYVIINDLPSLTGDDYYNLISFYTYMTRSLTGVLIKDDQFRYKTRLNLQNDLISYTSDYALPGASEQADIKQEKIAQIATIIGDYKIQSKPEKKHASVEKTSEKIEVVEDSEATNEALELLEEGEKNKQTKQDIPEPSSYEPNPVKLDKLFTYSFYNHLGLSYKDRYYYPKNTGSALDLDGLFGDETKAINRSVRNGFIKFKNALVLNLNLDDLKLAISHDAEILDFFFRVCPQVSDAEIESDRRLDVIDWIQKHLTVSDNTYVFAKKYNKSSDFSASTVDGDPNALKENDAFLLYGKKVSITDDSGNVLFNQYISLGVLPKPSKIPKTVERANYDALVKAANEALAKENRVHVFDLGDVKIEPLSNLRIRRKEQEFVSMWSMKDSYGVQFESDASGNPIVRIINDDKVTINGVESFRFLHHIAQTETSDLTYAERILQLEKSFVINGKLIVKGKYFVTAKFDSVSDFKRVLILEPRSRSFEDLLRSIKTLNVKYKKDPELYKNWLDEKLKYLSHYSQLRLLEGIFNSLGYLQEDGTPIESGLKDAIEYTLSVLESKRGSHRVDNTFEIGRILLEKYDGKPIGMDFISEWIRYTDTDRNMSGRYAGILLLEQFINIGEEEIRAKKLPEKPGAKRQSVDLLFDLSQLAYENITTRFGHDDTLGTEFIIAQVAKEDMWRLGTRNCFVETPLFGIDDSSLKGFTLLSKEDSVLKHNVIDYTNLSLLENEEAQKEVGLSEEEIKARFNPKEHVTYALPGKYFYKVDNNLSKKEITKRKKFSIWTNGLQIRVGDVVELYGDSRHVYRVSYIDKTIGKIYFDERDGLEYSGNVKFTKSSSPISAIKHREIHDKSDIYKDYYSSPRWERFIKTRQADLKLSSRVVPITGLSDAVIQKWLDQSNGGGVLLYPVKDSDPTILTRINEGLSVLQDGKDVDSVGIYGSNSVEGLKQIIDDLLSESDLNGIAVISLLPASFNKFMTNRKGLLESITTGYIKSYISFTENPKMLEKDQPSPVKSSGIKVKQLTDLVTLAKQAFKDSPTETLENLVNVDSIDDLKSFKDDEWFKYWNGDKWSVRPKLKLVKTIDSFESLLSAVLQLSLVVGDTLIIKKDKSLDSYEGTVTQVTDGLIEVVYLQNDKEYKSVIDVNNLNLLWGYKYSRKETTTQTPEEKQILPDPSTLSPEGESQLEESSESLGTEELLFDELHEKDNEALTAFIKSLNMGRKEDALVLKVKLYFNDFYEYDSEDEWYMSDQSTRDDIQEDIRYIKDHISDTMEELFDDDGNRLKDPNCN